MQGEGEMSSTYKQGYAKPAMVEGLVPLMVQRAASTESKFLSLKIRYITSQYLLVAFVLILATGCATIEMKLFDASLVGDNDTVKALLAKDVDINAGGVGGATPLMGASQNGHTDTVKVLLAEGADVDAQTDAEGLVTALMYATGHTDIVKLLLDAGADTELKNAFGFTVLMQASH